MARAQLNLFYTTLWVTAFIFVIVGSVLAYATLRFRARTSADEHAAPPPQSHGNFLVEIGLVSASVLCLVIIAVPTLKAIWFTYDVPAAEKADAYEITATGTQWWFKFEYPKEQINGVGPLVTANELVIPAGRPVHIDLRTLDVVHSFWVPKLAGKVDMIPNRANHLWLEADQPGYFYGQCAEFCGDSHALMRFRVIALPAPEFAVWLANQERSARVVTPAMVAAAQSRPRVIFASWKDGAGTALSGSPEFDADPFAAWKEKQVPDPADENAPVDRGRPAPVPGEDMHRLPHDSRPRGGRHHRPRPHARRGANHHRRRRAREHAAAHARLAHQSQSFQARQQDVQRRFRRSRHRPAPHHAQQHRDQRPRRVPAEPEMTADQ